MSWSTAVHLESMKVRGDSILGGQSHSAPSPARRPRGALHPPPVLNFQPFEFCTVYAMRRLEFCGGEIS